MTAGFERFAGLAGLIVAAATFAYTVAFAVALRSDAAAADALRAILLIVSGILLVPFFVALHERTRDIDPGWALSATLLGTIAALAAAAHGAFDIANVIENPAAGLFDVASESDPRGFFTFGVTGLAVAAFSFLLAKETSLDGRIAVLGYALSVSLLLLFVITLITGIAGAGSRFLSFVVGFALYPVWVGWMGATLRSSASNARTPRRRS